MYQNTQKYWECQLIAIWNAARFYGMEKKVPKIGTPEYEEACEKYCCKHGSCLGAEKELKRFGLRYVEGEWDFEWLKDNLPVVLSVYPPDQRAHAVLAVNCEFGGFEVANMGGGVTQWYSFDKLRSMQIKNRHFLPQSIKKRETFFEKLRKKK